MYEASRGYSRELYLQRRIMPYGDELVYEGLRMLPSVLPSHIPRIEESVENNQLLKVNFCWNAVRTVKTMWTYYLVGPKEWQRT